jgi:CheY-like chemotaxis protein
MNLATVLVIEDDPPTRKLIRAIVEDQGYYDVWEASNGEEGVISAVCFSLIL